MGLFEFLSFVLIFQIFILLNPLDSFPLLISAHKKKMNVRAIAYKSVIIAFILALVIVFIGPFLFNLFGISLDSFRVAGGIILFLLGLSMVQSEEDYSEVGSVDGMISLIATPLLTGPAVISFITIKTYEIGKIAILTNLFFAFLIVAVLFILLSYSVDKINEKIINILSKVLGLFLTAVAIEMIVKGVLGLFKIGLI